MPWISVAFHLLFEQMKKKDTLHNEMESVVENTFWKFVFEKKNDILKIFSISLFSFHCRNMWAI